MHTLKTRLQTVLSSANCVELYRTSHEVALYLRYSLAHPRAILLTYSPSASEAKAEG